MNDYTLKLCCRCGAEKPATREYFYICRKNKDGLFGHCIDCHKRHYIENHARIRENSKRSYANNRQKRNAESRDYQLKNRERLQAKARQYYIDNKTRIQQYRRDNRAMLQASQHRYYELHREYYRELNRLYHINHREHILASKRLYHIKTRGMFVERKRAYMKHWMLKNPHLVLANRLRRKARERDLPGKILDHHWQRCLDYFNHRCAVCGNPAGLWHKIVPDHWIALADPRPDNPGNLPWNIVPMCHAKKDGIGQCNNSKRHKPVEQWLTERFGKRKANRVIRRVETYFEWVRQQDGG